MSGPLRVLIVEDSEDDALLEVRMLEQAGYAVSFERVQTAETMRVALTHQPWDLVLSDHSMPQFSALQALAILRADGHDHPLIIVSGTIGEDAAVAAMRAGAHDYVLKDRLARLAPAVERELREAAERRKRRQDLDALRTSEQVIQGIVNAIPVRVFWKDRNLVFLGCNAAFARDAGFADPKDIIGKDDTQMPWRDQAELYRADDRRVISSGCPKLLIEEPQTTPAGDIITRLTNKLPLRDSMGEICGVLATYMDITERKHAEAALLRSQQRLELAQRSARAGLWDWDIVAGRVDWSPELFGLLGLDTGRATAGFEAWGQALHPEDLKLASERIEQAVKTATPLNSEYRVILPSGDIRWINALGSTLYDEDRRPMRMSGICLDITERKRTAEALRESECAKSRLLDRLNEAQALAKVGSWEWDPQSQRVWWSDETYRMLGVTPQDYIPSFEGNGKFVHPADLPRYRESFEHSLRTGEPLNLDLQMVTNDGVLKHCQALGKVVHDASGKSVSLVGTIMDISERKQAEADRDKLEAQLRQAQKMESVGRLAGGVAHDFNNLLMGIMNYVELCRDELSTQHPVRSYLDAISSDAQRSADITRQLLAFARKQIIVPQALALNDALAGMLKTLRHLMGEDIDLAWVPGAAVGWVRIDPGQLDQILVNLIVNARDAIAGVGKVTIETADVSVDPAFCREHADAVPGEYARLTVSDSGKGMDRETLEHLFEPFFTTKELGQGTGLGLATVYGIVRQNNGFVGVDSEPGKGTSFRVHLPRCVAAAAPAPAVRKAAPRPGGTETILLVEDEKSIRVTTQRILELLGYAVLAAATPTEALRLAAEHPRTLHLLISDVVMPELSGRDLARRLTELRPALKCLFVSGYTANIIAHRGILDQDVHFLAKPFMRDDLARKVREVLDGPPVPR